MLRNVGLQWDVLWDHLVRLELHRDPKLSVYMRRSERIRRELTRSAIILRKGKKKDRQAAVRGEKLKSSPIVANKRKLGFGSFFHLSSQPHRPSFVSYHHERKGAPRKYLVCRYAALPHFLTTRDGTHIFHPDANTRQDATQQMETAAQDNYVRYTNPPHFLFMYFCAFFS